MTRSVWIAAVVSICGCTSYLAPEMPLPSDEGGPPPGAEYAAARDAAGGSGSSMVRSARPVLLPEFADPIFVPAEPPGASRYYHGPPDDHVAAPPPPRQPLPDLPRGGVPPYRVAPAPIPGRVPFIRDRSGVPR